MIERDPKAQTPPEFRPPEHLEPPAIPDHQLLRRIGRGSYGEVWLARSVTGAYRAVKIVQRRSFDHDRPFEREFSGILKFEPISRKHDSQMDILHVGRGHDCFFYVMELADDQFTGQQINPDSYAPKTLKSELFRHGKLPFEECVQISLSMTTALENLQSQGLVHRDIKPSNVIYVNGVVKLSDIGLVTSVDASRSYVGTEGFVPPEGPGTPQADIYSLGKVLYELCTGKDRQEFPELPSDLDALPDRDGLLELNAVIAKACREDPRQRYPSAQAMHRDLLLLQSGKSLARLHAAERTLARVKRTAVVAGVVVLVLAAGLSLATIGWRQARVERDKAMQARAAEETQRKAAQSAREQSYANFQMARDAVDQMLTRVATDLAGEPRMVQLRRTLLEDALKFYQQFVQQKADDPDLRYDLARAYMRVGDIYKWLGENQKVLSPTELALVILDELGRQHPTEPRYRVGMVEANSQLGSAKISLGRDGDVIAHARNRVGLCEDLQREFPSVPDYLYFAASAHDDLGVALRGVAPKESLDELRRALKLYESHRARFPNVLEDRARLAHIHHWLGSALQTNGRYEEAEREYRQSIELRTQLVREQPLDLQLQYDLVHVKAYLADLLARTGHAAEAAELMQEAIAVNEQGLNDQLRHAESARRAGIVHRDFGDLLLGMHQTAEADKNLRRAIELHGGLAQNLVEVPEYRAELAEDQYTLGLLLQATGRSREAAEAFRNSIELCEQVNAETPQSQEYSRSLGWMLATCPALQFRDPPRALALARQVIQRAPESGDSWRLLGIAQYRAGQPIAAIESLRKALELTNGGEPEDWFFLALANWQDQNHQQAWQWYNKAIAWIDKHPASEELDRFHAEAAAVVRTEK